MTPGSLSGCTARLWRRGRWDPPIEWPRTSCPRPPSDGYLRRSTCHGRGRIVEVGCTLDDHTHGGRPEAQMERCGAARPAEGLTGPVGRFVRRGGTREGGSHEGGQGRCRTVDLQLQPFAPVCQRPPGESPAAICRRSRCCCLACCHARVTSETTASPRLNVAQVVARGTT